LPFATALDKEEREGKRWPQQNKVYVKSFALWPKHFQAKSSGRSGAVYYENCYTFFGF